MVVKNSFIDLPVIAAIEYFSGMIGTALKWASRYGIYIGCIGIAWTAIKVMMSRMTIKDLWWDTLFKWCGFVLLMSFYPVLTFSISAVGHELGMKAGTGEKVIIQGLTSLRNAIKGDLEVQKQWAEGLRFDIESQFDNLNLTTQFENNMSYDEYIDRVKDEIKGLPVSVFNSKKAKSDALSLCNSYRQNNKHHQMFTAATLQAIEGVLHNKNLDGEGGVDLTNTYVDLDIYLLDKDGKQTSFISPAALFKVAILSSQIMWEKELNTFNRVTEDISDDESNFAIVKGFRQFGHSLTKLPNMIVCLFCCAVLIIATAFAVIQYVMTILEYTIITGIGAIFIPLILFDGTKDIPKKLVPVFTSFLVKIMVITICLMFVYWLLIQNCVNTISDDGGFNFLRAGEIIFEALFCYILTQNAPKIAQTILTGQPQLSMGEALQAGGALAATGAGMGKVGAAATRGVAKGTVNTVGKGVEAFSTMHGAAKDAAHKTMDGTRDSNMSMNERKSASRKAAGSAALGSVGAMAKQSLANRVKAAGGAISAGASNFMHGKTSFNMLNRALGMAGLGKGGSGGGGGDGSKAQNPYKDQNANIGTAKNADGSNMTLGQFMAARASAGATSSASQSASDKASSNAIKKANKSNNSQSSEPVEKATEGKRASD